METDVFVYGPWDCIADINRTERGTIVIRIINAETQKTIKFITIIMPEEEIGLDETIIDIRGDEDIPEYLIDAGILTEHIRDIEFQGWDFPVYRLSPKYVPS
ncbi:MAG: hypothetical protein APG11_01765 [Candidatus Methanofastidiosum methylothiophilum]|uniref:Uncharacterized protein n=1 Tax=Candidatus Methanofastidiosum methylothiophilum TaxID=1705564 RepID=A0A150IPA2_9EURY|nr:MAG: hypothetical protein APG11_01765 [Candidatus Methanofastidiosum methylthiophilus]